MNLNIRLFQKINSLVGKNRWLDAIGRAGAEWVIIAMLGWYVSSVFIDRLALGKQAVFWPLAFLGCFWSLGWVFSMFIGLLVREPRPYVKFPDTKKLFVPLIGNWKSFPSDHTFAAFLIYFLAIIFSLPLSWPLLVLAIWVALGRVYAGVHYPFDTVGGLALAGLVGMTAYYVVVVIF